MSEQEQSLLEQQEEQEEETAARPWWGTLLVWLGMVVLIVALIVGGVVLVMYRSVTMEALPERTAALTIPYTFFALLSKHETWMNLNLLPSRVSRLPL